MAIKRADGPSTRDPEALNLAIAIYDRLLAAHERATQENLALLTEAGVCYVRRALTLARSDRQPGPHCSSFDLLPFWDAEQHHLWLGKELLKEFRQAASNQVAILDEFQRRGWAIRRIDDPLPAELGDTLKDRRYHLHETLKNLNRDIPPGTIRFRIEPGGTGVRWDYCANDAVDHGDVDSRIEFGQNR